MQDSLTPTLCLRLQGDVLDVHIENSLSHGRMVERTVSCSMPDTLSDLQVLGEVVLIDSFKQSLMELDVLVHGDKVCIVLEGCSGCGKTALLKALSQLHGRTEGDGLVTIHLGEQVDGKMLLGAFTCASAPGEFVWVPGILTKAVLGGQWVVLEDIDCAPSDVVSLLLSVVKSRSLMLPGYSEPIRIPHNFKMFTTKRLSENWMNQNTSSKLLSILENHCSLLGIPPYTHTEKRKIISTLHQNLVCLCDQLMSACDSLSIHIRQLLKFCNRVSDHIHNGCISSVDDLMLELIDCFVNSNDKLNNALKLRSVCGGMSLEKVEQLCFKHKPSLQQNPFTITVGRGYLSRSTECHSSMCFAYTQQSLCLMEKVCRCVQMNEPVLLVGETGVGKTTTVHYLANVTGNKLVVVNMNQQSDSTDLLGGFKPVPVTQIVSPVREKFEKLFHATFSLKQNAKFLANIQKCFAQQQWQTLFKMMQHSFQAASKRLKDDTDNAKAGLYWEWQALSKKIEALREQLNKPQGSFVFNFVQGVLVNAVRNGWWILLDEINLATAETLQCLSSLLEGPRGSFLITEQCDMKPVERHQNFRLFCCMNPATDVGKKSLPYNIRNRFSEFYVEEVETDADLHTLISGYLVDLTESPQIINGIIRYYRNVKEMAETRLLDGTGRKPHYSLRNLCRGLNYAAGNPFGSPLRSLYEGLCMSFLTQLRQDQHHLVIGLVQQCLGITEQSLQTTIPSPKGYKATKVEGFWLALGSELPIILDNFVLTKSVKLNLKNLARVVSASRYPVLLQGPTSAGKTSLVQYLAKATGHKCLRVNNHEHTDLQEYIGMYTAGNDGQLVFQEGVLVEAMRKGYWIILDELNLAPTDVLEALNRVLDDNRELFIPETHQVVKAHPHFLLFGTQNPPGQYGGRKVLSQAFRNRFIELHYEDIPSDELVVVLQERCKIPQSYAKRMVAVMKDLQQQRSTSGIFAGKYGLITLRDLFRWAERYRRSSNKEQFQDWEQQLAEDGFMLLAGRVRNAVEEDLILDVIQKHFKREVKPSVLFGVKGGSGGLASEQTLNLLRSSHLPDFSHIVWTPELLRMAVLVNRAIQFDEPVLLVGNTGCGKTSVCQLLSLMSGKRLLTINCHMHTEASDFLGGLRPVRRTSEEAHSLAEAEKLFEWHDGILVQAMQTGSCLLIDEISLAEDAVLERLNSVLEPERKLLVSERGSDKDASAYEIVAHKDFVLLATMNPGGDYGKKELSLALRNRFVEVWCPAFTGRESCAAIINHNLKAEFKQSDISWSSMMLDITDWMQANVLSNSCTLSIRDLLTWVSFMNVAIPALSMSQAFYHGAHLTFLDGLGSNGYTVSDSPRVKEEAVKYVEQFMAQRGVWTSEDFNHNLDICPDSMFGIPPFYVQKGPKECKPLVSYSLKAKGPHDNAYRLLRGLQLQKPILLEGGPGVGKTTLVTALAKASGHGVVRINLSEHTDTSDLFGSDLPVEGTIGLKFAWKDGPFLKALKNGDWILLDEMNLASQSVLESLNACLDHRGEVYIPELDMTFKVQMQSRLFACQNPLQQGGGRKGLPKSFLNRFTQVFISPLTTEDLLLITTALYPNFPSDLLKKMILFNEQVEAIARQTGNTSWEFNLRDVLRWCELVQKYQSPDFKDPGMFVELIYVSRLRNADLCFKVRTLFEAVFSCSDEPHYPPPTPLGSHFHVTRKMLQVGYSTFSRENFHTCLMEAHTLDVLHNQMPVLDALLTCVNMGWMSILVGSSCGGKSSVVKVLADLTGNKLVEFPMNSDADTTELLGGFEQLNCWRHCSNFASLIADVLKGFRGFLVKELSYNANNKRVMNLRGLDAINNLLEKITDYLPEVSIKKDISTQEMTAKLLELEQMVKNISEFSQEFCIKPLYDMQYLREELQHLSDLILPVRAPGQFEWVDSSMVKALKLGHWLLISNANFCSPSVLDRLNALLEPGGVLTVDERGIIQNDIPTVKPHPNFRLFLAMDPAYGELSRAMRNRGIEIYILPQKDSDGCMSSNKIMTVPESVVCPEVAIVNRHCSSLLTALQGSCIIQKQEVALNDIIHISSELALFTAMTSCSDCHIRLHVLHQMTTFSKHVPELRLEVQSALIGLKETMDDAAAMELMHYWTTQTGADFDLCIGSVWNNPLIALKTASNAYLRAAAELWLYKLTLKTMRSLIEEHCGLGVMQSQLQVSFAAHTGSIPLDCLEDISLLALYPFLFSFVKALAEAAIQPGYGEIMKIQTALESFATLLRLTLIQGTTLSDIAVAIDFCSEESFNILGSTISTSECAAITGQIEKLKRLKVLLLQGQLLASWKSMLGHRLPMCSKEAFSVLNELYHKDRILCKNIGKSGAVCDVELRRELGSSLVQLYIGQKCTLAYTCVSTEGVQTSEASTNVLDHMVVITALKPVTCILMKFVIAFLENGSYPDTNAFSSLLQYSVKLPFVDITHLEPFFILQANATAMKEFIPQLLALCTLSGYFVGSLSQFVLGDCCMQPCIYQNNFSDLCYELLSPEKPVAAICIGNFREKREDISKVLQRLWIHGTTDACSFPCCCYSELSLLKSMIQATVSALARCILFEAEELELDYHSLSPERIRQIFCKAAEMLPEICEMLRIAGDHLVAAYTLGCSIQPVSDLSTLLLQKIAAVHLGITLSVLVFPCSPIDPVGVERSKWKYLNVMLEQLSKRMAVYSNYLNVTVGKQLNDLYTKSGLVTSAVTPYLRSMKQKINILALQLQAVDKKQRPNPLKYPQLLKLCLDMMKSICSPHKIEGLLNAVKGNEAGSQEKVRSWNMAAMAALSRIVTDYGDYPDMVQPLVMALLQVVDGLNTAADIVNWQHHQKNKCVDIAADLLDFTSKCHLKWLESAMVVLSDRSTQGTPTDEWNITAKQIMIIAVDVSHYCISSYKKIPLSWKAAVTSLLETVWAYWQCIDRHDKAREKEKEELYVYKTRHTSVKDEEDSLDSLFPSYSNSAEPDVDGHQFESEKSDIADDSCDMEKQKEKQLMLMHFTCAEMMKICGLYMHLYSHDCPKRILPCSQAICVPFSTLYELTASLMRKGSPVPGSFLDDKLAAGHIRMCAYALNDVKPPTDSPSIFNIYKDPLTGESQKALLVVDKVRSQVEGLLTQWPEHPVLMQILIGCGKALQSDINDPLMKILAGLEYILLKAQEWETNASMGVSLRDSIEGLTSLILEWRKMELNSWKKLFLICESEARDAGAKWWFHLLSLCNTQANKEPVASADVAEFTTVVHMLMENSPVGEYLLRLQLLHSSSRDFYHGGHNAIADVLGNTFAYYEQFLPDVTSFIRKHAEPLERELQDFVTIQRWSDGNYWALKTSTEKSRKTLKKLMNKYKVILQETVQTIIPQAMLACSTRVSPKDEQLAPGVLSLSMIPKNQEELIRQSSVKIHLSDCLELSTHEIYSRMTNMIQSYSAEEVHLDACYAVADLIDQATETHRSLESFQMHVTEAKAVKMQLEQHKKALNDMFKALRKEGLSYRKGLISKDTYNCKTVFNIPVGHFLSDVLDGNGHSENHKIFFESVIEMKCLESFLGKPSKQLNPNQLSRIQGFTAHLLRLICEEKGKLGSIPEKLLELNHIVGKFGLAVESAGMVFPTSAFNEHKQALYLCFEESIDAITELQLLLESKPTDIDFSLTPFHPSQTCIELFIKGESLQAFIKLQEYAQHMKDLYQQLLAKQWKCRSIEEPFATRKEVDELAQGYAVVRAFAETLCGLGINESNPLYGYLASLGMKLLQKEQVASTWIAATTESVVPPLHCTEELYTNHTAKTLRLFMMGIQKVMLLVEQNKSKEGDDSIPLLIIHDAITKNLENIGLSEVVEQSEILLSMFLDRNCSSCLMSMCSAYYLLQQYGFFVTKVLSDGFIFYSHMCKLFSAVLKLFCVVTNKGFHSDVSNDDDKENMQHTDPAETEAGGFDDGSTAEDSKNVDPTDVNTENSNLTENKEENSQDGKDDENVLENCENFEGALETVEDGNDSKSDEGSQSDCSEEMGPIEENEDSHLDEHMWAPDENEKADLKPDADMEQGQGTAMDDEQKIVAKDEDNTGKGGDEADINDENHQFEEEPPHSDAENDDDLMGEPCDGSSVDDHNDDINANTDSDDGGDGASEEDKGVDDQDGDKLDLENDFEEDGDNLDDRKEDADAETNLAVQCQGESGTNIPESISSSNGLQDAKEDIEDSSNTNGMGACENQMNENKIEDVDNSVKETSSDDNNQQKQQNALGQPLGRNAADKRPREASSLESTHRPTKEHNISANNEEMEASVKRLKLTNDTSQPMEEDVSSSSEYFHKPDGSATTWDAADEGQQLNKNLDDEACIEIDSVPVPENPSVHKQSAEKTASYFSDHTPFSADINLDIVALKQMRQMIQAGAEPAKSQDQYKLAADLWVKYETLVLSLSNSLYEELRIILQPTLAAHLRGDFRSGKKLNMRRIVPYIASGFRNDKIWLRRVKPSRRDYEILIAVDDSSSMAENDCVEMAYKSIAMISGALQRLDCGQLGVFKFGEDTEILHPFYQPFTTSTGAMVLQKMTFSQTRTNFVKMLQTAAVMFSEKEPKHHIDIKQLLIILSDGRGVFSEGETAMELATRYMNQMGILTVFIIMDCSAQDSVVNIQVPIFRPGQVPQIKKYLETFPFQFYVVLKDVISLPTVLGQALHQWFEYINKL